MHSRKGIQQKMEAVRKDTRNVSAAISNNHRENVGIVEANYLFRVGRL